MSTKKSTLGTLLKDLRNRNRWTLKEMSERSGIPISTLSNVEHDRLTLTYDKLLQLSQRLNIRMSELFADAAETGTDDDDFGFLGHAISPRRRQIHSPTGPIKPCFCKNTPRFAAPMPSAFLASGLFAAIRRAARPSRPARVYMCRLVSR